jgi:Carboxypeptidase regulatory-like domain
MSRTNFHRSQERDLRHGFSWAGGALLWLIMPMLAFWIVPCVRAQVTSATIVGNVSDPSGAAIPGASITATNEATGKSYTGTTASDGTYIVPLLPIAGSYTVTINVKGFETFVQKGIILRVNQNVRVDAKLQLGQVTQVVAVTGQPPQVETTRSSLGEVVSHREISQLPLNGRNPIQLVSLAAGVTAVTAPAVLTWRGGSYWSSNGTRSDENQVLLDGSTYEGAYFNNALNLPSPDALQEFKLITNTYSAEYGRNAGSVLNAVVKSGTNQFHGDLWEFLRNDALNARNFFLNAPGAKVAKLDQNQFGFTAGGPIIKNKWFLFGSYQGLRISQQTFRTTFPPTAQERQGIFTEPPGKTLIDPSTGQPFLQNAQGQFIVPTSDLDPVAVNVMNKWLPLPGQGGTLTQLGAAPTTNNQFLIKSDYEVTQKHTINFMWMRDRTSETDPFASSNLLNYAPRTPYTHINMFILNDTYTFRPNLLNQFRAAYIKLKDSLFCGPQQDASQLGVQGFVLDGQPELPDFSVPGRFGLGTGGLCGLTESTPTRELSDTLTWIKGRHDFTMGGDFFKNTNIIPNSYLNEGNFSFSSLFTGDPLADFLLGKVTTYFRQTSANDNQISWEYSGFFQDDWKLTRRLTLNLGLRYYVQQPWVCTGCGVGAIAPDTWGTFFPGFHTKRFATAPTGILYPGDTGPNGVIPRGLYPTDLNNLEPRVGFAWDPWGDGKTSVRASYGVFHDYVVPDAVVQATFDQPYFFRQSIYAPPGGLSNPYLGFADPWPYRQFLSSNPQFYLPMDTTSMDFNSRNAVIQSWMLDVQHQLTDNLMVDVAYAGKVTDGLIWITDVNPAIFIPGTDSQGNPLSTLANVNARRPYAPDFAAVRQVGSYGRSSYHSLQVSTEYRFRHGLSFHSAYTWSHSLDLNSSYNVAGGESEQSPFCLDCEKGNADYDLPSVFVFDSVYNIPTPFHGIQGFSGAVGRQLLGNWEISGIMRLTSGFPFSCHTGGNNLLNGLSNDRCDTVGNWKLSGGRSDGAIVQEWFNTAAFVTNSIGEIGTSGRNFLRGPRSKDVDIGLLKNFPFKNERYGAFQFRAEFFNAFNWVNFGTPNSVLASPSFGRITTAGDPRLIQFALKYTW